jgi:hypothetical protein
MQVVSVRFDLKEQFLTPLYPPIKKEKEKKSVNGTASVLEFFLHIFLNCVNRTH